MPFRHNRLAFGALLLAFAGLISVDAGERRVFLDDVKALTLRKGKHTRGKRSTVPQLECRSGPCDQTPSVVQCRNVGSDGYETQWKCEAEFPAGISFDQSSLVVSCEGYDHPDDPYITAGSCGLEYSLVDRRNQQSSYSSYDSGSSYHPGNSRDFQYSSSSGFNVWGLVFIGLVGYVLYAAFCSSGNRGGAQRRGRRYDGTDDHGGGPGGGNGGNGGGNGGYGGASCGNNVNPHAGGGFWQGLGLGGLAGYMLGGRRRGYGGYGYGGGYGGYNRFGGAPRYGGGMRFGGGRGGGFGGARAPAAPRMGSGFAGTRRR